MTCVLGVSCCHTVPTMDFVMRPTTKSWLDGGGAVGVGGWPCCRRSNRIACCDNGCWRFFSALMYCTLARCAFFWGNWDVGGAWVTTIGCQTCFLTCYRTGGWLSSIGGHCFANIDSSLSNASTVSLLLSENGASGAGLRRAWIRRRAASTATFLVDA